MKKKIVLKRIFHRDKWRIAICFEYDNMIVAKVKSITGAAFSETRRCFYVDDTEENLKLILNTLNESANIDISEISWKRQKGDVNQEKQETEELTADSHYQAPQEEVGLPEHFRPKTIRKVIGDKEKPDKVTGHGEVEIRINEKDGMLVIKFPGQYNHEWISEMRSYGTPEFDPKRKEWLLPYSKLTADSLADYFAVQGAGINLTREAINDDLKAARKLTGDDIRAKPIGKQALDGLELMTWFLDDNRYSPRTRESYLAMLEFFFRYFSPAEPSDISEEQISRFLYDFIIKLGYSASYQNQMVSAIKTYYSIAGNRKVDPDFLERPRRRRSLPKVFSKEEVTRILNSGGNLKHKMLLWLIYSCGLRRSEVTNLRLTDLDRERGILHVREGKGRVDRFVPVPAKVWEKLDEYFGGYRPRQYLFEGQSGGRYSSESVYRVFKDALVKAGIRKEVGVHSLRHSYATHLHENGLDIRYIQELLGHKSTRTTEIYTHVSRRNLVAVRSPIEDLDLK